MRINLMMDDNLVKRTDEAAKALGISRSAYICMATSQKLQQDMALDKFPELIEMVRRIEAHQRQEVGGKNDKAEGKRIVGKSSGRNDN